jgi:hypothetical protein
MHTIHEHQSIDIPQTGFGSSFVRESDAKNQIKRLKIREFISWSVCFAFITIITGLLKFLKIGITMDTVTSVLFYFSIAGLAWSIYKIFSFPKYPDQGNKNHDLGNTRALHGLN